MSDGSHHMSQSALTVANYFLDRASAEARALTPMQLIKLVYIAHGWHLGYFDRPLINERVEAWKFGPVIDSLYQQTKRFGSSAVSGRLPKPLFSAAEVPVGDDTKSLLISVWGAYRHFSGLQLSAMTHQDGTPWDIAWNKKGGKNEMHAKIDDADIKAHYKAKIASQKK